MKNQNTVFLYSILLLSVSQHESTFICVQNAHQLKSSSQTYLGSWKSRVMVDRYAKYATEHLAVAANRIQRVRDDNVVDLVTLLSRLKKQRA
jgi:predicted chitinase